MTKYLDFIRILSDAITNGDIETFKKHLFKLNLNKYDILLGGFYFRAFNKKRWNIIDYLIIKGFNTFHLDEVLDSVKISKPEKRIITQDVIESGNLNFFMHLTKREDFRCASFVRNKFISGNYIQAFIENEPNYVPIDNKNYEKFIIYGNLIPYFNFIKETIILEGINFDSSFAKLQPDFAKYLIYSSAEILSKLDMKYCTNFIYLLINAYITFSIDFKDIIGFLCSFLLSDFEFVFKDDGVQFTVSYLTRSNLKRVLMLTEILDNMGVEYNTTAINMRRTFYISNEDMKILDREIDLLEWE